MTCYRHKQSGKWMIWILGSATTLILVLLIMLGFRLPASVVVSVVLVFLALCLFIFASMTVEVTAERVSLWFGSGLIRKNFPAQSIRSASKVRNHWYYGWGIRLTPHGWLFNVSGLDAVQIELRNGRKYRIGTDQPEKLLAAIRHSAESYE